MAIFAQFIKFAQLVYHNEFVLQQKCSENRIIFIFDNQRITIEQKLATDCLQMSIVTSLCV